jgi:hypothetical protein
MFVLIALAGVGLMAGVLLYLVQFAVASRHDTLFHPAESANIRRARRVTGMYARGGELVGTTVGRRET